MKPLLQSLLIAALTLLGGIAHAQIGPFLLTAPAASSGGGGGCTLNSSYNQPLQNNGNVMNYASQHLKVTNSITVCKVIAYVAAGTTPAAIGQRVRVIAGKGGHRLHQPPVVAHIRDLIDPVVRLGVGGKHDDQ